MAGFEELTVAISGGYSAYARYWKPESPRGAVLYHHGIQSHCGWYATSAKRLAQAGFAVLQIDRRGSGQNRVDRGHAESADQLIEDSQRAGSFLIHRSGFDRFHLVGVSWGGKLAVVHHVTQPEPVRSLSLVTPGLFPKIGVSRGQMAKIGFAMLYEPRTHFDIPLNDANLFTTSPRWQAFFRSDEPTLRQCTAGFYLASRRMDKLVLKLKDSPSVPVHLFLAGDERIVDNDKTASFVEAMNWSDTRITRYAKARHSVEFEQEPEGYFRDLVGFIAEHT